MHVALLNAHTVVNDLFYLKITLWEFVLLTTRLLECQWTDNPLIIYLAPLDFYQNFATDEVFRTANHCGSVWECGLNLFIYKLFFVPTPVCYGVLARSENHRAIF